MTKYQKIIEKVLEPSDFESALACGLPCFKAVANKKLWIEGHSGIELYSDCEAVLLCKGFKLRVCGRGLHIPALSREGVEVAGIIESVSFERV